MIYKNTQYFGIINITPDSFSDGGVNLNAPDAIKSIIHFAENGVNIIDIGAKSTRPNAQNISDEQQWARLKQILEKISDIKHKYNLKISLDCYDKSVIKKALDYNIDIINDVSGLSNESIIPLIKKNNLEYVLMHSLSVPADKNIVIPEENNAVQQLLNFAANKIKILTENGVAKEKIIFDIGIGFGKTPKQNISLIQNISAFDILGCKIMVGHSRKSFLNNYLGDINLREKDIATKVISMLLIGKVDYLRVHNI